MVNQPTNNQPTDDVDVIFIQSNMKIIKHHKFKDDAELAWGMMGKKYYVIYIHRYDADMRGHDAARREFSRGVMTP